MSIVLNENEWAKRQIENRDLGRKPSETLRRVARYYLDSKFSKAETRRKLDTFLIQCDPTASLPKWSDALDYALNRALKYDAIDIDGVTVTDRELERIEQLDGRQVRRLAFTLLCLAKYWNEVTGSSSGWVNSRDNEIMAMANINTSIKRQSNMYWLLRENGMVEFSKKVDNTNVKVCFITDGEPVIEVTDFRNLGYQYMMYCGEPYFECANCGLTTKYANIENRGRQKYCNECAAKIKLKQSVESVMRQRDFIKK